MFSKDTKNAIIEVAGHCLSDMDDDGYNPMIMAEIAIDANRLTMFGYPKADKEVHSLIKEHGYEKVLEAVAKFVPTHI